MTAPTNAGFFSYISAGYDGQAKLKVAGGAAGIPIRLGAAACSFTRR
jgi:hypothetical protein